MTLVILLAIFLLIDAYFYQGVLWASKNWSPLWKNALRIGFWIPTAFALAAVTWWTFGNPYAISASTRNFVITGIVATYFSKVIGVVILLGEDLYRGVRWVASYVGWGVKDSLPGDAIPRSEFLSKIAVATAALPAGAFVYGIVSGAHDYRIRRVTVSLKNLPKSFDGVRIGQISDIHSGSFWNRVAVQGGVDQLMKEKPDMIFFTGDLVNNQTNEVRDYLPIFGKVKAPLGVFSVTGNHDYGDYHRWTSPEAKSQNFRDLVQAHRTMGYDILMNENRIVEVGGEKIAILGNENWGVRFSRYGKLDQAYQGSEEAAVKLLLSHDPTHWDAEVRPKFPDIDMMFAGHTHGFQFGVEISNFKWSPVQYVYKQWADLHREGDQYLYVNRGFGYIGYPGRVGIPPELTIFELKRGA
jgi:predicted MPP superfamily phosphohydrolase